MNMQDKLWEDGWQHRFNELFKELPLLNNVTPVRMFAVYYLIVNCKFLWQYRKRIFNYSEGCFDEKSCNELKREFWDNDEFFILLNAVSFICSDSKKAVPKGYEIKALSYRERNILLKILEGLVLEL